MQLMIECCVGLDVHQVMVMAMVRISDGHGGCAVFIEMFRMMTDALLMLRDWLQAHGVMYVVMESMGVYWKFIYYVLENAFTLLLVNIQYLKQVLGRKSDVWDSAWIAQLLEAGLLRGSLVPLVPIWELRDLIRYWKYQIRDRIREVNRLHCVLEDAGIKLSTVATDVMGALGCAMMEALVHGITDPVVLADLVKGKFRVKLLALQQVLVGHFRFQHRFLIARILAKVDFLDEVIESLTKEIDCVVVFFRVDGG